MKETLTAINTVKRWVDNPLSRFLLKYVCKECDNCGRRLDIALRKYSGENDLSLCINCKIAASIVSFILNKGADSFDFPKEEFKKYFSDVIFRRGVANLLEDISIYGIIKPQVTAAPFMIVWDFTSACNLKCVHCYERADKPMPDELKTEEAFELIDHLVDAGVVILAFSGGEPLLRKDFFEVLRYANKNGLYTSLATNGTLITSRVAKKLKKRGINYVEISLHGVDAKTHDDFTGVPGAFEKTIQGIKNCVKEGLYTCIATTVTKTNINQIPKIYKLACCLGVRKFVVFNFIPTGRGKNIVDQDITPEQREKLSKFLFSKLIDSKGVEAYFTAPQFARVALEEGHCIPATHFYPGKELQGKLESIAEFIGGCGAGRLYCSIEPNGDVQPCVFMPIKVGNIKEFSLKEIWHGSDALKDLRDRSKLKGNCNECKYKFVCGGCRARAYGYFKDIHAPDPGCIFNKWSRKK